MRFVDRNDAGRKLAARLKYLSRDNVVVLALPRGGVPVAHEVSKILNAPLDVILVRKLGAPWQPELALGAIGEGGIRVLNDDIVRAGMVSQKSIDDDERREAKELARRVSVYRQVATPLDIRNRHVLIVDDGLATGATAHAACAVARARGASRITLAVPVAPAKWEARFEDVADECVSLLSPEFFASVGQFYEDFPQVRDEEVIEVLTLARRELALRGDLPVTTTRSHDGAAVSAIDREVGIPVGHSTILDGHLMVPSNAKGLVIFVRGSGSSRRSPRNRSVARTLQHAGFGTLLFDLLTPDEADNRALVFDIPFLAARLSSTVKWLREQEWSRGLPIGLFGASTGAAAALWFAAEEGSDISAVVSRGGRPDLALDRVEHVACPVLCIVGGHDHEVMWLNETALKRMKCPRSIEIVPGASHLFSEPGALDQVAELARAFFVARLNAQAAV